MSERGEESSGKGNKIGNGEKTKSHFFSLDPHLEKSCDFGGRKKEKEVFEKKNRPLITAIY